MVDKRHPHFFIFINIITFCFQAVVPSDLGADRQALLDFATAVLVIPGNHKLDWNPRGLVCNQWVGIKCSDSAANGRKRVVELHLPGFGIHGCIPEHTIDMLDALETLNLENNFLTGSIPPGLGQLPRLKHLNLSNNYLTGSIPSPLRVFPPSSFGGNNNNLFLSHHHPIITRTTSASLDLVGDRSHSNPYHPPLLITLSVSRRLSQIRETERSKRNGKNGNIVLGCFIGGVVLFVGIMVVSFCRPIMKK